MLFYLKKQISLVNHHNFIECRQAAFNSVKRGAVVVGKPGISVSQSISRLVVNQSLSELSASLSLSQLSASQSLSQ